LLAVGNGVGILAGEYVIGVVADRWGRRVALILSSLALGLLLWPTARAGWKRTATTRKPNASPPGWKQSACAAAG
jgi:MFS family permease